MAELDETLRRRYARQISLEGFGEEGQARLGDSAVLIVGLGGLGSPAALYLAAAGVGRLTLVDFDAVEESNLHRQVLYATADVGRPKVQVGAERLRALNPGLEVRTVEASLDEQNAVDLVRGHDLVLDGADNFAARYAVNDACVRTRTPNVHGAVQQFEGQVMVLATEDGPCYRCLFPEPPPPGMVPSCAEAGVLGVLPGTVGLVQATEAIKLLTGLGEPLAGTALRFDALRMHFTRVRLARDPDCPACGAVSSPEPPDPVPAPGRGAGEELPFTIPLEELARRREEGAGPLVLDVRLAEEVDFVALDGPALHIPLHLIPERLDELDPSTEYAVICHHGIRSRQAVHFLRAHGIAGARDAAGGIDRWAAEIDTSMRRY